MHNDRSELCKIKKENNIHRSTETHHITIKYENIKKCFKKVYYLEV